MLKALLLTAIACHADIHCQLWASLWVFSNYSWDRCQSLPSTDRNSCSLKVAPSFTTREKCSVSMDVLRHSHCFITMSRCSCRPCFIIICFTLILIKTQLTFSFLFSTITSHLMSALSRHPSFSLLIITTPILHSH